MRGLYFLYLDNTREREDQIVNEVDFLPSGIIVLVIMRQDKRAIALFLLQKNVRFSYLNHAIFLRYAHSHDRYDKYDQL